LNSLWSFKSYIFWWTTTSGDLQLLMNLLLMNYSFWWRHHFRSTLISGAILFRCFKLPFCWFLCSLLFFQNLLMISNIFYGPVHLNKYYHIQLTIFNTLLSSKLSRGSVKYILSQHNYLFFLFLITFTLTKQLHNHLTFYSLSIHFHSFNNLSFYFLSFHFLFWSKQTLRYCLVPQKVGTTDSSMNKSFLKLVSSTVWFSVREERNGGLGGGHA